MKKKRTFEKLSPQRRRLLKVFSKSRTIAEAAKAAGYTSPQGANNALKAMRPLILAELEKIGWDAARFAKHQAELLGARKTQFFAHEGEVTDQRTVKDYAIQIQAQDMSLKILGVYAPLAVEHSGIVEHVLSEREKREAENSVKCLLAENGDGENAVDGEFVDDES